MPKGKSLLINSQNKDIGIIILAGGKSRRMGRDKAFLKLGKQTLIEIIVNKAKAFCFSEIILVTNEIKKYSLLLNVKIVKDFYPDLGPLAGIHAGLIHSKCRINFVVSCDMPFISLKIVNELLEKQSHYKVVVPKENDKYQPLAALYTKDCAPYIKYLLEKKESKVIKLYDLVKTCYLDVNYVNNNFLNINTPKDFEQAKKLMEGRMAYEESKS
ncbi:molybdopterin-guanine dinucleotide biosynthesis protein A [Desulfohalotomaculum tongense]|uniref:molybdenum cofactor guanylyltransferase n=1 Tax=Desulforadius tongensis TaxID=1216062 RepID=UPI00195D3499|nr:molybdenum cofactor guanylyltransferase [Desulforadius tongensis]MBM7854113.1 molybdopterin-guanine dinucleotide biosynthesis protein A [Desulforadius tongensis]